MSPPEFEPPSTRASGGNGYGPGSLSSLTSKVMGTSGWLAGTVSQGMPYLLLDQSPQSG